MGKRDRIIWQRDADRRGRHFTTVKAGTYAVTYRCDRPDGRRFVGTLNTRELKGVFGSNLAVVQRMIETRIKTARRIARAKA